LKDEVTVTLDTTGESLHKRGYRYLSSKAPLTETLAAALILLTPWLADRILNFNSDLYYQSREYIALCYKEGEVLLA